MRRPVQQTTNSNKRTNEKATVEEESTGTFGVYVGKRREEEVRGEGGKLRRISRSMEYTHSLTDAHTDAHMHHQGPPAAETSFLLGSCQVLDKYSVPAKPKARARGPGDKRSKNKGSRPGELAADKGKRPRKSIREPWPELKRWNGNEDWATEDRGRILCNRIGLHLGLGLGRTGTKKLESQGHNRIKGGHRVKTETRRPGPGWKGCKLASADGRFRQGPVRKSCQCGEASVPG